MLFVSNLESAVNKLKSDYNKGISTIMGTASSGAASAFSSFDTDNYSSGEYYANTAFVNNTQAEETRKRQFVNNIKNNNYVINYGNSHLSRSAVSNDTGKDLIYIDDIDAGNLNSAFLSVLSSKGVKEHIVKNTTEFYEVEKELKQVYSETSGMPSQFNPYYAIKSKATHTNLPIRDDAKSSKGMNRNLSDCSIWKLLQLSGNGSQGQQYFRLADFMYCKDLGKVSNNHMIVLRRYASPVGDNIYKSANDNADDSGFAVAPDVGHLVTWFGTDDNKLSDIIKMNYHATWREMQSGIEEVQSKADDAGTGVLGMIANSLNPNYNALQGRGGTGTHNLISALGSNFSIGSVNFGAAGQNSQSGMNSDTLTNYDKHKVYEPKNTIQRNHYYEGKIEFEHEFTLNFSYKLRAYDTINSKTAMLDLIGNILEVTFQRGKFWGGAVKMIGPPQNDSALKKMNAFIDETWDKLEGFSEAALTGMVNWQEVIGSLSDAASNLMNAASDEAKKLLNDPSGTAKEYGTAIVQFCKDHKIGDALKGQLKNALGRPAMYAMSSLVKGDVLGLWHVTIGNPRNPIMCFGNLILTNAELSFGDCPLGLDDFPTEVKVAVTLKHCKPRDLTEMSKMFTRGESSIYMPLGQTGWAKSFYAASQMLVNDANDLDGFRGNGYYSTFGTNKLQSIGNNFSETSR